MKKNKKIKKLKENKKDEALVEKEKDVEKEKNKKEIGKKVPAHNLPYPKAPSKKDLWKHFKRFLIFSRGWKSTFHLRKPLNKCQYMSSS